MTDPLTWSINLGRWSGTQVRVHMILVLFIFSRLFFAAVGQDHVFLQTACWLALLLLALAVHELGHAAMSAWLGCERDEVRLWPLGNMMTPLDVAQSADNVAVALAGPAVSFAMVVVTAIGLSFAGAQFVWNPFGNDPDAGAPKLVADASPPKLATDDGAPKHAADAVATKPATDKYAPAFDAVWFLGWFGYLNWLIFLFNIVPALPFDMGRVVQAILASPAVIPAKDNILGPWIARAFAAVLGLVGLVRLLFNGRLDDGITLLLVALLIELMVRSEPRVLEDGGFLDDGVFGYDFSEGYTSLESSAAKVRPYRESALKRWRRRRSELRRQRRQAREAAEEQRMDEILAKLYREGRSALTDEEHRFLIRVSAKYRNRPRARE
jgi:Zn-dependent protease